MLKFEAKKGDFAKIGQKLGGYSPPAPPPMSGDCCSVKHRRSQTLSCAIEAIIRKCLCFHIKRLLGSDPWHVNR